MPKPPFFTRTALLFVLAAVVALSQSFTANAQSYKGVVVDSKNEPLVGAVLTLNGILNSSVTTDFNGNFEFSNVTFPVTVKVSYMGFNDLEIKAEKLTDLPKTITLKEDVSLLEEVVVVAYGVRKKGTIAGSVSSVKGDIVENTPAASFDQSLQGQVPGLTVLSSSGSPSASATFAIRGTNSINSGTSPLFILDGAPISSSDFNTINPNDIDNISVLKDASSTSIYGARAANGGSGAKVCV